MQNSSRELPTAFSFVSKHRAFLLLLLLLASGDFLAQGLYLVYQKLESPEIFHSMFASLLRTDGRSFAIQNAAEIFHRAGKINAFALIPNAFPIYFGVFFCKSFWKTALKNRFVKMFLIWTLLLALALVGAALATTAALPAGLTIDDVQSPFVVAFYVLYLGAVASFTAFATGAFTLVLAVLLVQLKTIAVGNNTSVSGVFADAAARFKPLLAFTLIVNVSAILLSRNWSSAFALIPSLVEIEYSLPSKFLEFLHATFCVAFLFVPFLLVGNNSTLWQACRKNFGLFAKPQQTPFKALLRTLAAAALIELTIRVSYAFNPWHFFTSWLFAFLHSLNFVWLGHSVFAAQRPLEPSSPQV